MDEQKRRVVFSQGKTKKKDYGTPQDLFDNLHKEFNFTIDVAASHENAKLPRYFTPEEDGLSQSWEGERTFLNPPYGIRENRLWAKKAYEESQNDCQPKVMLLAARTDAQFFTKYCAKAANLYFIEGRLTFEGSTSPAGFPSVVVVFHSLQEGKRKVQWCNRNFTEFW
jgi:site-specific DNA-methyltransferase (adenine-specific)